MEVYILVRALEEILFKMSASTDLFDSLQNNIVLLMYGRKSVVMWMKILETFPVNVYDINGIQFPVMCPGTDPTLNIPLHTIRYWDLISCLKAWDWKVKVFVTYIHIWNKCAYTCVYTQANTLLHISSTIIIKAVISLWDVTMWVLSLYCHNVGCHHLSLITILSLRPCFGALKEPLSLPRHIPSDSELWPCKWQVDF
jgi:hypothetical protein